MPILPDSFVMLEMEVTDRYGQSIQLGAVIRYGLLGAVDCGFELAGAADEFIGRNACCGSGLTNQRRIMMQEDAIILVKNDDIRIGILLLLCFQQILQTAGRNIGEREPVFLEAGGWQKLD